MTRVTKRFVFEAAHFLPGHEGKCKGIHGHSYGLEVTVGSYGLVDGGSSDGMVIDFSVLKGIVKPLIDRWDHALLVQSAWDLPLAKYVDDREELLQEYEDHGHKVIELGFRPTAEQMAKYVFEYVEAGLKAFDTITVERIVLHETEDSSAEVTGED